MQRKIREPSVTTTDVFPHNVTRMMKPRHLVESELAYVQTLGITFSSSALGRRMTFRVSLIINTQIGIGL